MASRIIHVGFYQFHPRFGEIEANLEKVLNALNGVKADFLVLPELAFTGYFFVNRDEAISLAEDQATSPTLASLTALCHRNNFHLVTGFAEKEGDRIYNSALLIGPEGLVSTYRKLHLFNTEKDCFDPGNLPLSVVEVRGVKVGMMVCFDWVFPEVARTLALQGSELLCHPSNLVLPYCQQAMTTRCLENRVFAVTANRIGTEKRPHGELTFTGQSQITAPNGSILHRAKPDEETFHIMEIDIEKARDKNLTEKNHLFKDRRPEFYQDLC
jgi:predicted amidohydrolase